MAKPQHPAEFAIQHLKDEVEALVGRRVKPGTMAWFELQAKGMALSMLRGMVADGAHVLPEAAERYRKRIKVKNPPELEEPVNGQP